jgi:hypothetical protein
MNTEELYKYGENYCFENDINKENNINDCVCGKEYEMLDNDMYYIVCSECGICKDITYSTAVNYKNKYDGTYTYVRNRCYKKSSYLRNKLNKMLYPYKPRLNDSDLKILQKKITGKRLTLITVNKYMKKNKLVKQYDVLKTYYHCIGKEPMRIGEEDMNKLVSAFKEKERVYKRKNYKRFNYNFVLFKIFQEWNRTDLANCLKPLQDKKRYQKHEVIYQKLFNC